MQKVTRELESISQTLSADTNPESSIEYDRHLDTSSMVQEIEALCEKLNSTEDEDEQRALEEDITGKILWLCWCGTCAEVDELLPQVVDYIGSLGTPRLTQMTIQLTCSGRQKHLADRVDMNLNIRYSRIMFDAGAGTSKHQLLLDARAAEQAKWSGTTALRGTANTNTQGPSTSS
ncbi:hypothetical protein BKA82DRAFT_4188194 [Pisolithus tinctorius]|nr:hypothetical protein BKA82DRAFT_4188194 [Pisolithus tinctorius]